MRRWLFVGIFFLVLPTAFAATTFDLNPITKKLDLITDPSNFGTMTGVSVTLTGTICTSYANGGALTTDAAGNVRCSDDDTSAGGGDAITVNGSAATDPDFADSATVAWTLTTALTPDQISGIVVADSIGESQLADADFGDWTCSDGSGCTIDANAVALGTDTTNAYVADLTAGTAIDVSGGGAETANVTVNFDSTEVNSTTWGDASVTQQVWTYDLSSGTDPTITVFDNRFTVTGQLSVSTLGGSGTQCLQASNAGLLSGTGSACGSGGNSFETIAVPAGTSPVADSSTDTLTITETSFLTLTGTAATDTIDITQVTTDLGSDGLIAANAVALGTDTTNAYVTDLTAGTYIDVSGGGSETATVTVDVDTTEMEAVTFGAGGNASNQWTANLSGTDPDITYGSANLTLSSAGSNATMILGENTVSGLLTWYAELGGTDYTLTMQPGTQTQDIRYVWPPNDGDASQLLTTNGSGGLTWTTVSGTDTNADKEFVWPAGSAWPLEPAESWAVLSKDTGTNLDNFILDYDQSTDECRTVAFTAPPDITAGGTVTFGVMWYSASVTTNEVIWSFRHNSGVAEGVDLDQALTAVDSAADTVQGTAGQITTTTWTETQTNLGWAASDLVVGEFCRDANAAGDDFAADARAVILFIRVPRS